MACLVCRKPVAGPRTRFCSNNCSAYFSHHGHGDREFERACSYCGKTFRLTRSDQHFCSKRCWTLVYDLTRGARKYGPHGYVITCEVCNQRKAVPITWKGGDGGAKACPSCKKERRRRHKATWCTANPDKIRAAERRRGQREKRRKYKRELARELARRKRLRSRLPRAIAEIGRKWTALPPSPVPLLLLAPPAQRAPARELSAQPQPRVFAAGRCACCGESFVLAPGSRNAKPGTRFCSPTCAKRLYRRRRRSLLTGPISRTAVLIRDKGHCQLCGTMTDITAVVPDDLAAVIDHVVPLAKGGSDTMDNVQTAHFRCNSLKRDLSMTEYAALYGDLALTEA